MQRHSRKSPRERVLEKQVQLLADRLATSISILQVLEIQAGIGGDIEEANYWESVQDALIGRNQDIYEMFKDRLGNEGQYQLALGRLRDWLSETIKEERCGDQPESTTTRQPS